MKLSYCDLDPSNFGDALNAFVWPRILPAGVLDDDETELWVGFGSIIGEHMFPERSVKHVFGAGFGGYESLPTSDRHRWNYVFVRGPHTADALGIPRERAICDSAVLIRDVRDLPDPEPGIGTAFMPHYDSVSRGDWGVVCKKAGVTLIDPTAPPEKVLAQIQGADVLITEAMHGAIVADALRVPWIAVRPYHKVHRRKWFDWQESLGLSIHFIALPPSSIEEWVTHYTGRGSARMLRWLQWVRTPLFSPIRAAVRSHAARNLQRLRGRAGQLSDERRLADVTAAMRDAVHNFLEKRAQRKAEASAAGGSNEMILVPREPTEAMVAAAQIAAYAEDPRWVWAAMINAI